MIDVHLFFRDVIAPKIRHMHVDNYFRHDTWRLDPNSTVTEKDMNDFSELMRAWHATYHVNPEFSECIETISPWNPERRYWENERLKFRPVYPIDVYYEYEFVGPDADHSKAAIRLAVGTVVTLVAFVIIEF